jgi:acyl-CoA reductase-like NAD-dependent aldehyde dehydrogenase
VLTDATIDMVITKEETFGPVAPLYRFKTDGPAAYSYSRDISRIWGIAEALEYGIVGINEGIISTEIARRWHERKRHRPRWSLPPKGAKVVTGGKRSALGGTFFEPSVLTDVTTDTVITKGETFGPVAPLY